MHPRTYQKIGLTRLLLWSSNAEVKPGTVALEALFFASLIGVSLLIVIVALVIRTLSLPECRKCGFRNVRRSKSHTALDTLGRFFFLRPYRCGKCLRRFYCYRSQRATPVTAHVPAPPELMQIPKATDVPIR